MVIRGIVALAALIAAGSPAIAGEKPVLQRISCAVVRFYVAKYSEAAAETWARDHGATDAEIAAARRCLNPSTVLTASFAGK